MIAWGIGFASVGAILGYGLGLMLGVFQAQILAIAAGVSVAYHWSDESLCDFENYEPRFLRVVLLHLACLLPSVVFTRDWGLTLLGPGGQFSGSLMTTGLCVGGLLLAEHLDEKDAGHVRRAIFAAGAFTALICLMQGFGVNLLRIPLPGTGRATGLIGSPIDAGALLALLLAFAPLASAPLLLLGLLATGSKGAMLGAAVSLTPRKYRLYAFALASLVGVFGVFKSGSLSNVGRRATWEAAWKGASFMGSGPATFIHTFQAEKPAAFAAENPQYKQAYAHNAFLEALTTRGVFGLIGLLAFLAFPAAAGLWTIAMFNPISYEVVFVACVLAGLRIPEEES